MIQQRKQEKDVFLRHTNNLIKLTKSTVTNTFAEIELSSLNKK